jgi:hypothetical protein
MTFSVAGRKEPAVVASHFEARAALVRSILGPVRTNLDNAALVMACRLNELGMLTQWESFSLTLCLAMREVVDIAFEDGDTNDQRDIAAIIRAADDSIFAARWTPEEWWPYVARTQIGRDTMSLVRHIETEISLVVSHAAVDG